MTLRVASTGSGPDIALLHGWGLGAEVWDAVLAPLARQFRVHVLSLPGYDGYAPADDRDLDATAAAIADALPAGCTSAAGRWAACWRCRRHGNGRSKSAACCW